MIIVKLAACCLFLTIQLLMGCGVADTDDIVDIDKAGLITGNVVSSD